MASTSNWSRTAVIDAAEALLQREGFGGVSVRNLAAQLGCSRQVVYTHFGNVAGLWNALHQRGSASLSARIDELPASGAQDRILAGCRAYLAHAREQPESFQLVFGRPVAGFEPDAVSQERARDAFRGIHQLAKDYLVSVGVESGATRLAHAIWTLCHGTAVVEQAGHVGPEAGDAMIDQAVASMLRGWTA